MATNGSCSRASFRHRAPRDAVVRYSRGLSRFSHLLNRRVDHSLVLGAPDAALVSHGLAAIDRFAQFVNCLWISSDESATTARQNASGRHRPSYTPGMSWM